MVTLITTALFAMASGLFAFMLALKLASPQVAYFKQKLGELFMQIGQWMKVWPKFYKTFVDQWLKQVGKGGGLTQLMAYFKGLGQAFDGLLVRMEKQGVLKTLGTTFQALGINIKGIWDSFNWGWKKVPFTQAIGGMQLAWKMFMRDVTDGKMVTGFKNMFQMIGANFKMLLNSQSKQWRAMWEFMKITAKIALNSVSANAASAALTIQGVTAAVGVLRTAFVVAIKSMAKATIVMALMMLLMDVVMWIVEKIVWLVKSALLAAWEAVVWIFEAIWWVIKEIFHVLWTIVKIVLAPFVFMLGVIAGLWDIIVGSIMVLWDVIKIVFEPLWDAIDELKAAWDELFGGGNDMLFEIGQTIRRYLLPIFWAMLLPIRIMVKALVWVVNLFTSIISLVSRIVGAVTSFFGLKANEIGEPPYPEGMASGGFAEAGRPVFRLLGEGKANEAVIPLSPEGLRPVAEAAMQVSDDQDRRGGGMRGTLQKLVVPITLELDGEVLVKVVREYTERDLLRMLSGPAMGMRGIS
jgi:hypothetical protein